MAFLCAYSLCHVGLHHLHVPLRNSLTKALSTLSQKSETVAENGATVAVFCDSLTFLRQCGQGLTFSPGNWLQEFVLGRK